VKGERNYAKANGVSKVDRLAKPRMYEALLWTSPMRLEWLPVNESPHMASDVPFTFHGTRRRSVALLNPKTFFF
jgi:hypothetical protein